MTEETSSAGEAVVQSAAGGRLGGLVLFLTIALILGAGIAGTLVTIFYPFRDWYMHLLMYCSIVGFLLLYLRAAAAGQRIGRYAAMIVTVMLVGFFVWILLDLVPGQKVFYASSVLWREDTTLLYLPVGLLAGGGVALLLHCTLLAKRA